MMAGRDGGNAKWVDGGMEGKEEMWRDKQRDAGWRKSNRAENEKEIDRAPKRT